MHVFNLLIFRDVYDVWLFFNSVLKYVPYWVRKKDLRASFEIIYLMFVKKKYISVCIYA